MKRNILYKAYTAILFLMGIILSWGGMLYATRDPNQVRLTGILVSFIGYGVFFWAVLRYENTEDRLS